MWRKPCHKIGYAFFRQFSADDTTSHRPTKQSKFGNWTIKFLSNSSEASHFLRSEQKFPFSRLQVMRFEGSNDTRLVFESGKRTRICALLKKYFANISFEVSLSYKQKHQPVGSVNIAKTQTGQILVTFLQQRGSKKDSSDSCCSVMIAAVNSGSYEP